ncbi:biotin/lipoyl-binding protein [Ensifer sp. R-19]|uniref:biotin/lipoyl-binding protein n=1 Tax=Ensifer sp. R-19 TaxID=3404055 RepID=UPI003CEDC7FF
MVSLAPDVTGLVDRVAVADNAVVRKGDVLFTVDRSRRPSRSRIRAACLELMTGKTVQL